MHRAYCLVGLLAALALNLSAHAVTTERVAAGLDQPVWLTVAPGDSDRLYVLERPGRIRVIQNGEVSATVLDIRARVEAGFQEQGLLGLAFHPAFQSNSFLYVNYTREPDGATVVSRWTALSAEQVDTTSEHILLVQPQPFVNHNGGCILFGPDGYLYVGLGDGGSGGDPGNRAQSDTTRLGKLLRVDVESEQVEIWAKGLRNPWRFSFDRETRDLYIADVGQNEWEEISFAPASSTGGENYGWRRMEGNHCFNPPSNCDDGTLVHPIHEYSHDFGCSITGGYVYRGCAIPELHGLYFFADYCSNRIWSFRRAGSGITELRERTTELDPAGAPSIESISSFGEDHYGELYLCDMNDGEIFRMVPDSLIDENQNGISDNCETAAMTPPRDAPARDFRLYPAAPNPFNPETRIRFDLPRAARVSLTVYDTTGRRVALLLEDSTQSAGAHTITFDARALPSGIYLCRLVSANFAATEKLVLLR